MSDEQAPADVRWVQRLEIDGRALATLQRAIATARERALKDLEEQGISGISGSRDAVREAVISPGSEATWLVRIRSRNLTSQSCNPTLAHEIAGLIQNSYGPALQALHAGMVERAKRR